MPDESRGSPRSLSSRPRRLSPLAAVMGAALLVAGCAVAASPIASPTSAPAATQSAAPVGTSAPSAPSPTAAAASPAPSPSLPTQTDTAWGRIWDALPAGFPLYPGAAPATGAREPVSAEFTIAADSATVLAGLRRALEAAGYRTVSQTGPLEDGSLTIESAGSATGCRLRTTVGPLGGLTHITILFGAACPFR